MAGTVRARNGPTLEERGVSWSRVVSCRWGRGGYLPRSDCVMWPDSARGWLLVSRQLDGVEVGGFCAWSWPRDGAIVRGRSAVRSGRAAAVSGSGGGARQSDTPVRWLRGNGRLNFPCSVLCRSSGRHVTHSGLNRYSAEAGTPPTTCRAYSLLPAPIPPRPSVHHKSASSAEELPHLLTPTHLRPYHGALKSAVCWVSTVYRLPPATCSRLHCSAHLSP